MSLTLIIVRSMEFLRSSIYLQIMSVENIKHESLIIYNFVSLFFILMFQLDIKLNNNEQYRIGKKICKHIVSQTIVFV